MSKPWGFYNAFLLGNHSHPGSKAKELMDFIDFIVAALYRGAFSSFGTNQSSGSRTTGLKENLDVEKIELNRLRK